MSGDSSAEVEQRVLQAISDGFDRPATIARRTCLDPKRVTVTLAALRKRKAVSEDKGRYQVRTDAR